MLTGWNISRLLLLLFSSMISAHNNTKKLILLLWMCIFLEGSEEGYKLQLASKTWRQNSGFLLLEIESHMGTVNYLTSSQVTASTRLHAGSLARAAVWVLSHFQQGTRRQPKPTAEKQPGQRLHQGTCILSLPKQGAFRELGSPKARNVLLGTGLILLFKIQNPDLNNWGTNCHKKCQPTWTGKISTRLTCYVSNTTGCILGSSERGGSEEADEWHSSLPGSLLLAGGRPSKSKEPSFPGAQEKDKNN